MCATCLLYLSQLIVIFYVTPGHFIALRNVLAKKRESLYHLSEVSIYVSSLSPISRSLYSVWSISRILVFMSECAVTVMKQNIPPGPLWAASGIF